MSARRARQSTSPETSYGTIEDQIRALPMEMLVCRDIRHAWSVPKGFFKVEVEGGVRGALYVEREVVCERCGVTRVELFRVHPRWMEKLSYRYVYPKEYKLHGDKTGVHVAGTVQLEIYMRSIADFNDLG